MAPPAITPSTTNLKPPSHKQRPRRRSDSPLVIASESTSKQRRFEIPAQIAQTPATITQDDNTPPSAVSTAPSTDTSEYPPVPSPIIGDVIPPHVRSPRKLELGSVKRRLEDSNPNYQSSIIRKRNKSGDKRSKKPLYGFLRDPIFDLELGNPTFSSPKSAPILRKAMYRFDLSYKREAKTNTASKQIQALESEAKTKKTRQKKDPALKYFSGVDFCYFYTCSYIPAFASNNRVGSCLVLLVSDQHPSWTNTWLPMLQ
jgi:hypothetical protein